MSQFHLSKTNYNLAKYFALSAFGGVFLLSAALLQPFSFTDNSYAETKDVDTTVGLTETLPLPDVSAESINLSLEPNTNGDFASAEVTVGVSTNHVSGYTLTLSTEGTSTDLTHDSSNDYKITALSSKTSATDFASLSSTDSFNKWGFTTDNNGDGAGQTEAGYYYAVTDKDNPTTIKVTNGPANVSDTKVTFATKGKDLAAGTYSNTVVFTTIANPVITPIEDNLYMQDVTPEMCESEDTLDYDNDGKTYTLKDNRDENEYQVRKLADGHCWMVTNLRLGKTSAMTLSSSDTDITTSTWDLPASSNITGSYTNAQIHIGSTGDSSKWATSWGNYYNWTAATAGQGTNSTTSGNINVSICPKGWKLPKGEAYTVDYSWAKLYNDYSSNISNFQTATNTGTTSSYWSGNYYNGSLYYEGTYGYWWSRTAGATGAYSLYAYSGYVGPQYNGSRNRGFSVRCVLSNE